MSEETTQKLGVYEGIGSGLKMLRERRNLSLAQVSTQLRIRAQFIDAIEGGRFDLLPGTIYATGFVRAYAEFLGLDPEKAVLGFREEIGDAKQAKLVFPVPNPEQRSPRGLIIFAGFVIAAVIYSLWYFRIDSGDDQPRTVQAVPERLAAIAPPPSVPVSEPVATKVDDGKASSKDETVAAAQPASEAPPAPVTSPAPVPATVVAPVAPAAVPAAAPAPVAAAPVARDLPSNPANPSNIVLRATAETWIQIRAANDEQVISRLLRSNEELTVPDRPGLTLLTGNAGGLEVLVDGQIVPPLGQPGAVRRGISLSAETLKSGPSQ